MRLRDFKTGSIGSGVLPKKRSSLFKLNAS